MTCLAAKKNQQEKSAYTTLQLYLLLQAWFKKQALEQELNCPEQLIVREWFID